MNEARKENIQTREIEAKWSKFTGGMIVNVENLMISTQNNIKISN